MLHFDAHLDTWDTYFGAAFTHGTPFRRAAEEGILDTDAITTWVSAARCTAKRTSRTTGARFPDRHRADVYNQGVRGPSRKLWPIGNRPVYVSVDIDVLDPAHAPGTGTPEAGGLTSRGLLKTCADWSG